MREGKIDARRCADFGYRPEYWIASFRIGEVERVKKLRSLKPSSGYISEATSLTGRPGMRYLSEVKGAITRAKLGKRVASKSEKSSRSLKMWRLVRLD